MDTLDLTEYNNEMKRLAKINKAARWRMYFQANLAFIALGVLIYVAQIYTA